MGHDTPTGNSLYNSQLFLDDLWIENHIRIERVWHQPRKHLEPVMKPAYRWEGWCPCLYGTVLRIDGTFRMWYVDTRNPSNPCICYAESDDGVHWERPELGICEFDGSKKNNIVVKSAAPDGFIDNCSVIYEPESEWPFKLLYCDSMDVNPINFTIDGAGSRDGIHFEPLGHVLPNWNDRFIAVTEKVDGKYRIYGRGSLLSTTEGKFMGERKDGLMSGIDESGD